MQTHFTHESEQDKQATDTSARFRKSRSGGDFGGVHKDASSREFESVTHDIRVGQELSDGRNGLFQIKPSTPKLKDTLYKALIGNVHQNSPYVDDTENLHEL